ncbi:aldose epimerase family protein [Facklamia hominis]
MVTIENSSLKIDISEVGAQIQSVIDKKSNYEFIWQGDKKTWAFQAPISFPFVGSLVNNQYRYKDQVYSMPQDGFVREMPFTLQHQSPQSVSFCLKSTEETRLQYPFDFSLQVTYTLFEKTITVSFEVLNPSSDQPLYYSLGYLPTFNVSTYSLKNKREFDRVWLDIEPEGHYFRLPLNKEGLIHDRKTHFSDVSKHALDYKEFRRGPVIHQVSHHTEVILKDEVQGAGIEFKPSGMYYLGVWASYPKRADFIQLQAATGIPDYDYFNGDLTEKEGIIALDCNQLQTHDLTIRFDKSE